MNTATSNIKVVETGGKELHRHYPGQYEAQGCYVYIACASRVLGATYDANVGNGELFEIHYGHVRRYDIPCLTGIAANDLLERLAPLAERVCAGYASEWDGNNHVARLTDDALAAEAEIESLCHHDNFDDEYDVIREYEPAEWFDGDALECKAKTDDELQAMADGIESGLDDNVVIHGLLDYLKRRRDEAAE